MTYRFRLLRTAVAGALLLAGHNFAVAQDLPQTTIRVIGNFSSGVQTQKVEKPFWTQEIPKDSNGKIKVQYSNYDVMGIKENQMLSLIQNGVADFGSTDIAKIAGDDPVFEGCDLTGVSPDIETVHEACNAWAPVVDEEMQKKFGTKLFGMSPNPGLIFWCRAKISDLDDLRGKKVRVNSRTMADLITAIGGQPVTTPFAEVVPSLQRGVFDCAVTGSLSGNTSGWTEVTKYLYPLVINWGISYQSVSLKSWNSWDPSIRKFLTAKMKELDTKLWAIGKQANDEGVNCNIGKEPCTLGVKGSMTLVPVSGADREKLKKITENKILLDWARRCGKECAERWNSTVGKAVGISIQIDKM